MAILNSAVYSSIPSISNFFLYISALSVLVLLLKATYNRLLHPLRSIPGPFVASLSRLWWCRVALSGHQERTHLALHEQYGTYPFLHPSFPLSLPDIFHLVPNRSKEGKNGNLTADNPV